MSLRNDRLKKLESELNDLEQWLRLGLVPKKDITKHEAEIEAIKAKIQDEAEKLRFLKESGDMEEYVTPRKQPVRTQYTEMPSLPEIDIGEEASVTTEATEPETETNFEVTVTEEKSTGEEVTVEHTDEDDPFSDKNRWKRGMLYNDEDEW